MSTRYNYTACMDILTRHFPFYGQPKAVQLKSRGKDLWIRALMPTVGQHEIVVNILASDSEKADLEYSQD